MREEKESEGILGLLNLLENVGSKVKETKDVIAKHKDAIEEIFSEFLPEIKSVTDSVVQIVKTKDEETMKPVEEELLIDIFPNNGSINVIGSTFTTQPEVELNEDSKSITIRYGEKTKLVQLPCAVEYADKYLFGWSDPDKKIIEVLKDEFNIDWLSEAEAKVKVKTTDKIKYVYKDKEHKLSVLIDETDKATLSVNNERIVNLKLERDNGKIKVYRDSYTFVNGVLDLLFMKKEEKK